MASRRRRPSIRAASFELRASSFGLATPVARGSWLAAPLRLVALLAAAWLGPSGVRAAETWADAVKAYQTSLALERQGKYREALPHAQRCVELGRQLKGENSSEHAKALGYLGLFHERLGEPGKALALHQQALEIRRRLFGDEHPDVATSLNNLGVAYTSLGQYAKALPLCQQAHEMNRKLLGEKHPHTVVSLDSLARVLERMGEHCKALPLYEKVLQTRRELLGEEHDHVAGNLNDLARLYRELGEYGKALALQQQAAQMYRKLHGPRHPSVAASLGNLGALYHTMGDYGKALPLLERSLEIQRGFLGEEHPSVGVALSNLALLYTSVGEYDKALPLYRQAVEVDRKALGDGHPETAVALSNLAELYQKMGDPGKALTLRHEVLEKRIRLLGGKHPAVALTLNNLGCLYMAMGEHGKALPFLQRALQVERQVQGDRHPDAGNTLDNLASVASATGRLEEAWSYAQEARQILLATRGRAAPSAVARSAFLAKWRTPDVAVVLALKLGKKADVLELLEEGRSLALRELLAEARAQTTAGLPEEARRPLAAALARLNALNAQAAKLAATGGPGEEARAQLSQAELDYEALLGRLSESHEQFVAAETARAITSAQAAKSTALDGQTAIVGWVREGAWLWGYVVRQSGVSWVDLSDGYKPADERERIRRILLEARSAPQAPPSPADLAALYRGRFAPLETHLQGIRRLVVIAHDWAAVLPLEMLLARTPAAEEKDPAAWPWLAQSYEVSYAPSVTALDLLCRQSSARAARGWGRPVFALADPPFSQEQLAQMNSEQAPSGAAEGKASADNSLLALDRTARFDPSAVPPRIPGTRREAELVAGLLGRDSSLLLLGPDASERKLFEASDRGDLRKCRYVHLATHGLADSERPELSALVLARVPEDKDYDGLLQMREVFHLKLDADLVVLSACQTGLGKELRGEGIVGLSTAFFFAGTPSLILSLWNVPDPSTALLMHRFYSNLKAGQAKAAALREAKAWLRNLTRTDLDALGQGDTLLGDLTRTLGRVTQAPAGPLVARRPFAHPYYWAGFVLAGDPR